MILQTNTPTEINRELKRDLEWVNTYIRKKAKKLKLKIIASGITHREVIEDHLLTSPLNNKWFVTLDFCLSRKTPLKTKACCIIESKYGSLDYLILRGLTYGGLYHVRVTSHVISRMKERDIRFKDMNAGQIINRIFPHGEYGMGIYTNETDIPKTLENIIEKKDGRKNLFIATSTGIFFGYQEIVGGHGNLTIKTFITPNMLYTHKEQNLYRFCEANLRLQKHTKKVSRGKLSISMIDNSLEAQEALDVIQEYSNEMKFIPDVVELCC